MAYLLTMIGRGD